MMKSFVLLALLLALAGDAMSASKIKKIVVLMEENRSYDHFFGFWPQGNGLKGTEYNLLSTKDPESKRFVVDKTQPQISLCDPDHGTAATTSKLWGQENLSKNNTSGAPPMVGFIEWENMKGENKSQYCKVMSMMEPANIPIITSLASEFAMFDRFFAAHPGPTWPNRLFMLLGTSAGCTSTGTFYKNTPLKLYPQKTIFDQLMNESMTWKNYFNDTPWELFIETVANNPQHVQNMDQFFQDAKTGKLPQFSWINPRAGVNMTTKEPSNDQHPDHDLRAGERYMKDIYEALRASPDWNSTLFIITYDEHGGFYDHVATPLNVPPPGDGETSYPDKGFLFDRLGVRLPTILISPWLPKGMIISEPPAAQKPAPNSEYSLTSIIATARKLLGMNSPPLSKRDAWSATFEHVFSLTEPRTDCPMHLPEPAPPSLGFSLEAEARMPINGLQRDILEMHAAVAGVEFPSHLKIQEEFGPWTQKIFEMHKSRILNK